MAAIRSEDTGPEMAVSKIAHRLGYRLSAARPLIAGPTGFGFPVASESRLRARLLLASTPKCRYATSPKFWQAKFTSNVARDRSAARKLKRMEWAVLTVWACELKKPDKLTERLNDFLSD